MSKEHRIDRELKVKTRPAEGMPGVREIHDAYRPIWYSGGPYVLDNGPNGGRETPKMTESEPYLSRAEHLRKLTGNARSSSRENATFASSQDHAERSHGKPMKRPRASAD